MYKRLDEHPGGICSGGQDFALLDAFSTYFHETIHWWQHIGSTTGLLLSLSPILQTHINYEYLKSVLQNIGPRKPLNWDFPYGLMPTNGVGGFRDFLPSS
jgi:hypothetical protein